jgi:hypothetical protein
MTFWIGLGLGLLIGGVNALLLGMMLGFWTGYRTAAKDKWEAERHDEILERLDAETSWDFPEAS